jgi:hypothetical protein
LVNLFDTYEDQNDVLIWMNRLAGTTTTESNLMVPSCSAGKKSPNISQTDSSVTAKQLCTSFGQLVDLCDTYEDHNDVLI